MNATAIAAPSATQFARRTWLRIGRIASRWTCESAGYIANRLYDLAETLTSVECAAALIANGRRPEPDHGTHIQAWRSEVMSGHHCPAGGGPHPFATGALAAGTPPASLQASAKAQPGCAATSYVPFVRCQGCGQRWELDEICQ